MLALFLLIVFGLGMAFFATQNTGVVHVLLGSYLFAGIPLYMIVVGSVLLGVFMSWLISMADSLSSLLVLHGKDSALKQSQSTIEKLQKENHELSIEIANLKGQKGVVAEKNESKKEKEESALPRPSFFQHIRQNLA